MWIRLEDHEIDLMLKSVTEGPLASKLREPPHPDTGAFAAAVETSDELEVDPDTVISRGDEGASVMSWVWVSNQAAGFPAFENVSEPEEGLRP